MAESRTRVRAFLGAFGLEFPAVIDELGGAAEGLLGTTSWQPSVFVAAAAPESEAFVLAYRTRFGQEPPPLSMHGYAAARVVLAAMAEAARTGPPGGPSLREALARIAVETPLGRVRFDARGDPVEYDRVVVQIQQGRHVVVYPEGVAAARFTPPRP
jgi:branched-chain amino acid transport system substrate-binding protein